MILQAASAEFFADSAVTIYAKVTCDALSAAALSIEASGAVTLRDLLVLSSGNG
jgi:hypothetical protein